jgi:flagellar basal body-associated protein FliL
MPSPTASPAAPSAARRGKKLPLLLGATLVLLGTGGVVAYLRLARPQGAAGGERREADPGVAELEPFTLNLPDEGGDRHLRLTLHLVLDRVEVARQLDGQGLACTRLRDRILALLAAQSPAELTTSAGREALRAELVRTIGPLLEAPPFVAPGQEEPPARVLGVYFTEFLVQ